MWLCSQQFIFFVTYETAQKLECYITLGWKGFPGTKLHLIGPFNKLRRN
jgi:hypothetical protein